MLKASRFEQEDDKPLTENVKDYNINRNWKETKTEQTNTAESQNTNR